MDTRLEEIIEKQKHKDYNGMLRVFHELDKCGYELPSKFALLKSCAIQLSDDSIYILQDAEQCLLDVIKNDEYYIEAYIDLAFYYYAVEDNSEKSLSFFDQAISRSKNCLREAIIGKAKALADLNKIKESLTCLDDEKLIDETDFELIRNEINGG